ncbi:MAG: hypothetical protein Q9167_007224 [Letrouitia subvulpina]
MHLHSPLLLFFALGASAVPLQHPKTSPPLDSRELQNESSDANMAAGFWETHQPPYPESNIWRRSSNNAARVCKPLIDRPMEEKPYDPNSPFNKCVAEVMARTGGDHPKTRSPYALLESRELQHQADESSDANKAAGFWETHQPPSPTESKIWRRSFNDAVKVCEVRAGRPNGQDLYNPASPFNSCLDKFMGGGGLAARSLGSQAPHSLESREHPLDEPSDANERVRFWETYQTRSLNDARRACKQRVGRPTGQDFFNMASPFNKCVKKIMVRRDWVDSAGKEEGLSGWS